MHRLREMLMRELVEMTNRGDISTSSLDAIDKLTHSIKSIDTILAMQGHETCKKSDSKSEIAECLKGLHDAAKDDESKSMIQSWIKQLEN